MIRIFQYHLTVPTLVVALGALLAPAGASGALDAQPHAASQAATCPTPRTLHFGQGNLSGSNSEFARAAELLGAAPLRSWMIRRTADEVALTLCADAPWSRTGRAPFTVGSKTTTPLELALVAPRFTLVRNSAYPDNRNNGALWAGRGLAGEAVGGVVWSWRGLSGAILPSVAYHENRGFETVTNPRPPGLSPWVYPWSPGTIDWPQRLGERASIVVTPGQSYLQLESHGLALTLSNENLWWGPAQRYPLLLSNTAPGFVHLALGTTRPREVGIGTLEARTIWGRLEQSAYFDGSNDGADRLFAGLAITLQPHALPGFYLGLARAHVLQLDGLAPLRQLIAPISTMGGRDPNANDHPGYQLASIFGRWAFPDAGFEAYFEWATRARWTGFDDLLRDPSRDQAYVVGFQHLVPLGRRWLRTYGEHVQLAGSPELARDGGPQSFYSDARIAQGHTHRGQLLGAAIGPGSDAQILGIDLFTGWGRTGIFAERTRRDEDAYFTYWTRYYGRDGHDVALAGGFRQLLLLGPLELDARLSHERRRNRNFLRLDGTNWNLLRETNWAVHLEFGWRP